MHLNKNYMHLWGKKDQISSTDSSENVKHTQPE